MVDRISPAGRSAMMRKIKGKDTLPELLVRKAAHRLGFRYRVHRGDLPGKPDLVFGTRRKAIFVHGCFWHQHELCRSGHVPKANSGYWEPKLRRTKERDAKNVAALQDAGWDVMILWECEIQAAPTELDQRLRNFLAEPLIKVDALARTADNASDS